MVTTLWLLSVAGGLAWLLAFAGRAGPQPQWLSAWPIGTAIAPPDGCAQLVCVLHPACPCSMATVDQLAELVGQCGSRLRVVAVLARSAELPGATSGRLSRVLRALPGIVLVEDPHGDEARYFAATTSGDCSLFSPRGELLYRGGLTDARGHGGRSRGLAAVLEHLIGTGADQTLPVYGCAIADREGGLP